ncbi:Imm41 family immunity protein [Neisseria meningitidis]|uniref:Imm41 family immunity protein n=1 Tax=Neisseria meningitidis TaxID=487 RepID=UPI002576A9D4|nr:Imm41 family immunity protein [Neisseria meningitidis]MDM1031970.1 hypothetical protein [Neisseria meningitidis]
MCEFKDIIRNVPYFEGYDENSFIGKWYDDGVWDDEEYWKLENDLIGFTTMLRYIFTEKDIVNVRFDYYNKK